jgi:hypothetical protein
VYKSKKVSLLIVTANKMLWLCKRMKIESHNVNRFGAWMWDNLVVSIFSFMLIKKKVLFSVDQAVVNVKHLDKESSLFLLLSLTMQMWHPCFLFPTHELCYQDALSQLNKCTSFMWWVVRCKPEAARNHCALYMPGKMLFI